MDERRKLKRRHIMFYSRVFDRKTGKLLGYLGNITMEGYKIRMDLPEYIYQKSALYFQAESLWCDSDVDPNFHNTGFKLKEINQEDKQIITSFIKDYGLRE
jgi:hypothetical protein